MKIYLAADHAGFELKEKVKAFLVEQGYAVEDCGAHTLDADDDYPDFIKVAVKKVARKPEDRAILFGGSGQGEAMVANRIKKVRAAVYYGASQREVGDKILILSREHNDANVLSIGARFVSEEAAKQAIVLWLKTPFSRKERHARRIAKF